MELFISFVTKGNATVQLMYSLDNVCKSTYYIVGSFFFNNKTECTLAGAMELASSRTLPFLWDDASDFPVIEKLAVAAFNQVN